MPCAADMRGVPNTACHAPKGATAYGTIAQLELVKRIGLLRGLPGLAWHIMLVADWSADLAPGSLIDVFKPTCRSFVWHDKPCLSHLRVA